ncbi:MAG: NTP transferase domain-containing protein [Flammeovirgaceae bacterium]|nr:NTP transferase domain-containing protein [Flammeovirgaceae bacterium]
MKVKKAVITAAGRGERLYPVADTVQKAMLPVVDIDGLHKPVLQIIAEEAINAGVDEICVVCAPGDEKRYLENFNSLRENLLNTYAGIEWAQREAEKIKDLLERLQFSVQKKSKGYGHAVNCAKDFVNGEPFLLLLGDYLYVSHQTGKSCAKQLIDLATQENCSVSAVNPTKEFLVGKYGTLTGKHFGTTPGIYEIEKIIEKPSLSVAELELQTSGLRTGYYLCFFGMHVFQPIIFDILERHLEESDYPLLLTPALQELAENDKYLAQEVKGNRYDIGKKFGLLAAQVALGLAGQEKDEVLTQLVELLAETKKQ